jgi:hypothetical protein
LDVLWQLRKPVLLVLHVGFRRVSKLLETLEVRLLGVKVILFRVRTADHARDGLGHLGSKLQLLDLVLTGTTQLQVLRIHIWARCSLGWCWGFCMLLIRRLVELTVALKERSIRVFDTRRWVLLKRLWWRGFLGLFLLDVLRYSLHLGGGGLLRHDVLVYGEEALGSGTGSEGFACTKRNGSRTGQLWTITTWESLAGKWDVLEVIVASDVRIRGKWGHRWQTRGDEDSTRTRQDSTVTRW